ncbi:SDR family NAD(P)-dependent oxidoreductase [Marinoscillum furvescens]|uniref:Short-subunit dehydrogenase n=1 Tax=Marinoscillum furvescens DSM 4134 TaxID=1122208 RepID=A0A3D9L669_MARFU|nr:SDR family NAD(P)-dependent oxidoreductase [Marinoscillum furvescens]REE01668.1 short-subunit dehydrogenase [Marinoscillum furvescens DSM 4134]
MEKVIVIVGMGGGISYAAALKWGREGYHIAMISRNEEKLKAFQEMLLNDGIKCSYFVADAAVQKTLTEAFRSIKVAHGNPEVLLYNAARKKDKNILRESIASLATDFKTNVGGAVHAVKQVVRAMKKANKGTILFTGGGLAIDPHPNHGSLALGKAALLNLCKQLSQELNYTNIKVGTVVVKGFVQAKDLRYNPTAIAEELWKIHSQEGKQTNVVEY